MRLAIALLAVTFAGLAVAWSPARWAVSVPQIGILAITIAYSILLIRHRLPLPHRAVLPVLGIVGIGVVQLALGATLYAWQTSEATLYWLTNLAAFAAASSLAQLPKTGQFLRKWLFLLGIGLAFLSVIQSFTSDGRAFWLFETGYNDFVFGPFVYKNQYAAFLELLLPVAWTGALLAEQRRWTYLLLTAALFACSVASSSRAGLITACAELIVLIPLLALRGTLGRDRVIKTFGVLFILVAGLTAVVGPETVWARLQERDPYSTRRDMTAASVAMFRERPLAGAGLGVWPTLYPKYATEDDGLFANQAHNDWAQIAVEGGVPGLACFFALFLWALWRGGRGTWAIGLAAVLLHALVDYPLQRQALGVFFFLFAGAATASGKHDRDVFPL